MFILLSKYTISKYSHNVYKHGTSLCYSQVFLLISLTFSVAHLVTWFPSVVIMCKTDRFCTYVFFPLQRCLVQDKALRHTINQVLHH